MFLPNQKVVCVDGQFPLGIENLYLELPQEGLTYTIRDIVPGIGFTSEEGEVAVYLWEIVSPFNINGIERGFRAERFAPLQTQEKQHDERAHTHISEAISAPKSMN
jgi:hypothetical protein